MELSKPPVKTCNLQQVEGKWSGNEALNVDIKGHTVSKIQFTLAKSNKIDLQWPYQWKEGWDFFPIVFELCGYDNSNPLSTTVN